MKYVKSLFMILGLYAFCMNAQAHADWPGHWLLGVSGGYADRVGSVNVQFNYATLPNLPTTTVLRDLSDPGFIFGILAGYQATCKHWLMGIEANIDWHDLAQDHPFAFSDVQQLIGWNGSVRYKRPYMLGVSGRMGYAWVSYCMPYLRLGVEVGRDELESTFTSNPAVFPISLYLQDKKWIYRFLIGAGMETPLPCLPLTLRFEFDIHSKGKTLETNANYFDGIVNPNFESDMQPLTKSGIVSLVWNIF